MHSRSQSRGEPELVARTLRAHENAEVALDHSRDRLRSTLEHHKSMSDWTWQRRRYARSTRALRRAAEHLIRCEEDAVRSEKRLRATLPRNAESNTVLASEWLADIALAKIWTDFVANSDWTRHAFHPEILDGVRSDWPNCAYRGLEAQRIRWGDISLSQLPKVRELMTGLRLEQHVRQLMARVEPVARSTSREDFTITRHEPTETGPSDAFTIEHNPRCGIDASSRIYSMFLIESNGRFGNVHNSGQNSQYRGLGIGTAIYRLAATEHPEIRWDTGLVRAESSAVRAKLHSEDPVRWKSPTCPICSSLGDSWREASPELLRSRHPARK